ncbi:MAG TPA: hypothetical protein VIK45_16010 [Candidatus Dormibacteraeota bacterium]
MTSASRRFFRRLPRPVKRLWYAILVVTGVELALLAGTLFLAPGWSWLPLEIFSVSAWPIGIGLLLVLAVGSFTSRRPEAAAGPAPAQPREPDQPAERARPAQREEGGYEVMAARQAARLLAGAVRRPQGQAALRRTGRLVRAMRAAARPPDGEAEGERRPPRSSP